VARTCQYGSGANCPAAHLAQPTEFADIDCCPRAWKG
jgi:hypothetical protein